MPQQDNTGFWQNKIQERLENMIISLLMIAILIVILLIVFMIVSRNDHKRQMMELSDIRHRLEELETAVPEPECETVSEPDTEVTENEEGISQEQAVTEIIELTEEKQDAEETDKKEPQASTYNIGKSGKVYTKEELELLIKE